jgi:glycogen operon protein
MVGHRFNRNKLLLDPYVKAVAGGFPWNLVDARGYDLASDQSDLSFSTTSDISGAPKGLVVSDDFDWEGDRPLNRPLRTSVIYETHVRGLTMGAEAAVEHPGTYRGVVEKIPYFRNLGITAIELMPVQEFDEHEINLKNPRTGECLENYWGYSTISFFAPKGRYSSSGSMGQQVREFKEMVRDLHKAGIEIILDIVFNHTAEGDQTGPTLCFRGWDNSIYYILDEDRRFYRNFSGCGNTLNCNHPIVRTLIMDCLRYWVMEMHVDGFRFDLGSVLGRDARGQLMENPPILERIAEEPILRHTKIIAEAWDAAGAYQVGWFPGGRWAEWNDRFRDDVRRFWRGDESMARHMATRITGSSDLYLRDGRKPFHSINFITSHDGFTLNDLVSCASKHNQENGENNRDGSNHNLSSNWGVEGRSDDPAVEGIRCRLIKSFLATLFLSQGTPMLLGGDEFRRTQQGNNNPYCQNNAISWFDWRLVDDNADILRFCREIIAFRKRHPAFKRPEFYLGRNTARNTIPDISWYAPDGGVADWNEVRNVLALLMDGKSVEVEADADKNDFYIAMNGGSNDLPFVLPRILHGEGPWKIAIDTALPSPDDIRAPGSEDAVLEAAYTVRAHSLAVFISG